MHPWARDAACPVDGRRRLGLRAWWGLWWHQDDLVGWAAQGALALLGGWWVVEMLRSVGVPIA